jgi:hypothetical protein
MIRKTRQNNRLVDKVLSAVYSAHDQLSAEAERCAQCLKKNPHPLLIRDVLRIWQSCTARRERAAMLTRTLEGRQALRNADPEGAAALAEMSASLKRIIAACEMILFDPDYYVIEDGRRTDEINRDAAVKDDHVVLLRDALDSELEL